MVQNLEFANDATRTLPLRIRATTRKDRKKLDGDPHVQAVEGLEIDDRNRFGVLKT